MYEWILGVALIALVSAWAWWALTRGRRAAARCRDCPGSEPGSGCPAADQPGACPLARALDERDEQEHGEDHQHAGE